MRYYTIIINKELLEEDGMKEVERIYFENNFSKDDLVIVKAGWISSIRKSTPIERILMDAGKKEINKYELV